MRGGPTLGVTQIDNVDSVGGSGMFRHRGQVARTLIGLAAGTLAVTFAGAAVPALAAQHKSVSSTPASGTPQLSPNGKTEQVRQLVQCGSRMYAVGSFTKISQSTRIISRRNAFSFKATAPYTVTNWRPGVNGEVNSIAFKGRNCSSAYLGGSFSRVHGTRASNIVKVNTSTGAVRKRFARRADRTVETIVVHGRHVLTGGFFKSINGSGRNYYASLNSRTGRDDRYLRLSISGHYSFPGVQGNRTRIYNQQIDPRGRRLLVEGDFTRVHGTHREQIFMLSLRSTQARVSKWRSKEFFRSCARSEPFYAQAASWSPDGRTVYVAANGAKPFDNPASSPRTGLCDAASAFPSANRTVSHKWINYTGCDSLFSTAADSGTAYFGGHERWADNRLGCNVQGTGAVSAPGMAGLSPGNGSVIFNPTRSRGLGADDMLVTSRGLWIASDNFDADKTGSDKCGGVSGHSGICFLPKA
jgi:hypothetical protein